MGIFFSRAVFRPLSTIIVLGGMEGAGCAHRRMRRMPGTNTEVGELEHKVEVLTQLVEVSITLNSTLDLDRLLEFIIATAADVLDAEAASILLLDGNQLQLRFAAATCADAKFLRRIPVPIECSIEGAVFRAMQPVIVS